MELRTREREVRMRALGPPRPAAPAPAGRPPVPPTAWLWLLVGSAITVAVHIPLRLAGRPWSYLGSALYLLVVAVSLVAVVIGTVRYRPPHPLAWRLIIAGYALALVAEAQDELLPGAPFPSVKDACFLVLYGLFIGGMLVMARARIGGAAHAAVLDSLIVTTALGLLALVFLIFPFLIEPSLADPALSMAARAATLAYVIADMLLLAVGVLLAAGGPLTPPALALLLAGIALQLVDDTLSTTLTLAGSEPLNVAWLFGYACGGAAALHPSMRALTEPAPVRRPALGIVRIALLVAAAVLAPLIALSFAIVRHPELAGVLVTVAIVLALMVFLRLAGLSSAISAQAGRYQRLLDENVRAREAERLQIAADLHDGPIQRLASMGLTAELARRRLAKGNDDGTAHLLNQLTDELGEEVVALRRVMVELHPPVLDEWGLAEALGVYTAEFERRTGIRCVLYARTRERFDHSRETILYRVTQEALTNVAKHARAGTVWIVLSAAAGTAGLSIRDDGAGFDPATLHILVAHGHFGLAGIRERVELAGGSFRISSEPGKGTTIVVGLPPPGAAAGPTDADAPPAGQAAAGR